MNRIKQLKNKVDKLYQAKKDGRADWADWLHKNHIFQVADVAKKLADRYGANKDMAAAAADAVVHLKNDFYKHMVETIIEKSDKDIAKVISSKIERDFNDKIAFEEVREEVRTDYEKLRKKYGN
ncbi:MAG: hypothetical protein HYT20_01845 [Candidatus Nealsonbacteria bacterium]|nr:hypothetical protein [Candidatus Nealsonbacteria bacterium]